MKKCLSHSKKGTVSSAGCLHFQICNSLVLHIIRFVLSYELQAYEQALLNRCRYSFDGSARNIYYSQVYLFHPFPIPFTLDRIESKILLDENFLCKLLHPCLNSFSECSFCAGRLTMKCNGNAVIYGSNRKLNVWNRLRISWSDSKYERNYASKTKIDYVKQ
jgi:hypothetical protein